MSGAGETVVVGVKSRGGGWRQVRKHSQRFFFSCETNFQVKIDVVQT